jgi:hypothetical protein
MGDHLKTSLYHSCSIIEYSSQIIRRVDSTVIKSMWIINQLFLQDLKNNHLLSFIELIDALLCHLVDERLFLILNRNFIC